MSNTDINKTEIIDCIGIDLGTTNTVVSYFDEAGGVTELKINNSSTIPSASKTFLLSTCRPHT